jgi:tRNA(Ile)-lysidine synthase
MGDPVLRFEHKVIQPLRAFGGGDWLLAVSGGVDSMVMAEVIFRWSRLLKIRLRVAHVHHGRGAQRGYRDRAQKAAAKWCETRKIPFLTNEPEDLELKSEAALREYRLKFLRDWSADSDHVLFAHHQDDLLETRLMRLIRGTGAFGLRGMQLKRGKALRPLLECSRAEIENYARWRKLRFVADPSNQKTGALRNWVRHIWLPQLEKKRPGASAAMARSLEILSENAVVEPKVDVGLRRDFMREISLPEREKAVANYLRSLGLKNYGRRHVREVLKRMDNVQKNPTFRMLGVVFEVTPDVLKASRV